MTSPLDWNALRVEDAESRRLAQEEFALPVAIQAGAGTGKTATLVARVLAWSLGPGWERALAAEPDAPPARIAEAVLRRIVAITFTEAAAAEMDGRIDAALAQLARGDRPPGFDAAAPPERVAALRGALDQLVVQTIHAWCRRLLGQFPMEARLHPLFEVDADGTACAEAVRDVVSERLGEAYARDDETALALAAAGAGPREIEETLVQQLQAGATAEELADDPLAPACVEALHRRLADAHEALRAAAADDLGRAGNAGAVAVASALGVACAELAAPIDDTDALAALRARLLDLWEPSARNKLARWKKGAFVGKEQDALGARQPDVEAAAARLDPLLTHLEKLDVESLGRIARVLAALAADVEERLRRRGRVTFEMLLSRAAGLLAGHPDVAARLRAGIDQLLVDEFQDTDPRQCAIVAALALEGPVEARPGLFVVGDPKQSIYGWRHADLAAYEGLLARMEGEGGKVGSLCVNHRSVPAILEEVERVVRPVMRRVPGLQPAFEALAPSERLEKETGFDVAPHAAIEHWIPAELDENGALRRTRSPEATALEAEALARELRILHERHGVPYGEVGVLFRSRGDWDVFLGALRDAGVPYSVEGDRTYYRRREILDAAALTACVLDPHDGIALVALLRSSVGGVPDVAWVPLFEGGLPALAARLGRDEAALESVAVLLERTAEAIAATPGAPRVPSWQRAAAACLEAVAALRRSFARDPADRFVECLREALGFELVEAARFLGAWRAANLERFFDDLADALAAGEPVASVLRRIRNAVAEDEMPSVEPKPPEAADAVTVATLHGAKGLAWAHVYLMQLHKGAGTAAPRGELGREGGRLETTWCGWRTLGFDVVEARSAAVADAERVRTLYVGMTRARQRLVLCGLRPALQERTADSHATLLEARAPAPPDLDALAREERVRAAEASWVVPARVLRGARAVEDAPGAPPPEVVAVRVAEPLPDAAARMALPRVVPVSAMASAPLAAPVDGGAAKRAVAAADAGGAAWGRVVGTAIHAALERLDLAAPRAAQWEAQRARIEASVRDGVPRGDEPRAVADALGCWEALGDGPLGETLFALGDRVLARELSIWLSPRTLAGNGGALAATGAVSGAIDLLYRDDAGRLVVADYKTDRVLPGPDAESRARYRRQGALYCRAVDEALGPEARTRFEIWWLRHGVIDRGDGAPSTPVQLGLSL